MKVSVSRSIGQNEAAVAWLFILPNIIGFLFFKIIPIGAAFLLSFCEWRLLGKIKWVGFQNYADMFMDPVFTLSIKNTVIFTVISVPLTLALALLIATQLKKKSTSNVIFRTVYFIPYITTITAVATVWIWIFHPQGFVNAILMSIGIENPPTWLLESDLVIYALSIIEAWRSVGYAMLIYLAGLQNIPAELYEASEIDGASGINKFRHITWPMLTPTTFFLVVTSLIFTFQAFDLIYAVTDGGPGTASHVLGYYIYKTGFKFFRMGYSSALAILMSLIIIVITLIQWKGQKNWVNE